MVFPQKNTNKIINLGFTPTTISVGVSAPTLFNNNNMKKIIVTTACLLLAFGASAQEVTVKKGKATMDESYYKELVAKAEKAEQLSKSLESAEQKLKESQAQKIQLRTFEDSASYAIGFDVANNWLRENIGINPAAAGQGMLEFMQGKYNFSNPLTKDLLNRFQRAFEERQQQKMGNLEDNLTAGKKFMDEIGMNKSVVSTPSGLKYKCLKKGNGKKPSKNSLVRCHYTGTLIDGTKFDSSYDRNQPIEFRIGKMIQGWNEAIPLMDEGSKYILYIPPHLGYGDQPQGAIPPGSTLIFEVELLEVK